jgi:spore germination cell wall hydrolase CwlJ-like protein
MKINLKLLFVLSILFSNPTQAYEAKDIKCLTDNIYFEARGESQKGMEAVAYVTLNRVIDSRFPNNICGVVYQPSQFSWVKMNLKVTDQKSYTKAKDIALKVLEDKELKNDPTNGSIYFENIRIQKPKRTKLIIGNHSFHGSTNRRYPL